VTGVLLVLLGAAAALAPLLGPEIGLTIGSDETFDVTQDRLILSVIPGAAVALGGLLLLVAANRPVAMFGGVLALAGGIWLVVGPVVSRLWEDSGGLLGAAGRPAGDRTRQTIEVLTYHHGIGALITALAGIGLGRLAIKAASDLRDDHDRDRDVPAPRPKERVVEEPPRREPILDDEPRREERVVAEEPVRDERIAAEEPVREDRAVHDEPLREERAPRAPVAEEPPTHVVEPDPAPRTEVRPPEDAAARPGRSGGIVGRVRDRFS
jgi:hypothetical protein